MPTPMFSLLDGVQKEPEQQPTEGDGDKPSFIEQFFGTGRSKELGKERKRITKEYMKEKRKFDQGRRKRMKDEAKDVAKYRERYMREARLSQFSKKAPTKEELQDTRIKHFIKDYNKIEERKEEAFDDRESTHERDERREYHKELRDASETFRTQGTGAFKNRQQRTVSPLQHFFGAKKSAPSSRRNLAV